MQSHFQPSLAWLEESSGQRESSGKSADIGKSRPHQCKGEPLGEGSASMEQ